MSTIHMSNYLVIAIVIIPFGIVLGGVFVPIITSSQASNVAANTTENPKNSSGSRSSSLSNSGSSSPTRLDKFGIKEIYPTMQGGREWYINMKNPKNDTMFAIQAGKEGNITRQSDGSWRIADQKVRMSVDTPIDAPMWRNVEITGYAKVEAILQYNKNNFWVMIIILI